MVICPHPSIHPHNPHQTHLVVNPLLGHQQELGPGVRQDVLALLQPLLLVHGHVHRACYWLRCVVSYWGRDSLGLGMGLAASS